MMPLFGGALTACTYHFFYNSPSLDALVALQVRLPDGANPWLSEANSALPPVLAKVVCLLLCDILQGATTLLLTECDSEAGIGMQAFLTFLGNTTCAVAAFRIYQGSRASAGGQ